MLSSSITLSTDWVTYLDSNFFVMGFSFVSVSSFYLFFSESRGFLIGENPIEGKKKSSS